MERTGGGFHFLLYTSRSRYGGFHCFNLELNWVFLLVEWISIFV